MDNPKSAKAERVAGIGTICRLTPLRSAVPARSRYRTAARRCPPPAVVTSARTYQPVPPWARIPSTYPIVRHACPTPRPGAGVRAEFRAQQGSLQDAQRHRERSNWPDRLCPLR